MNKCKHNKALLTLLEVHKNQGQMSGYKNQTIIEDVRGENINTLRLNYREEYNKIITTKSSGAGTVKFYSVCVELFRVLTNMYVGL